MTTTAELVRGNADQLAAYRAVLEAIIAEPSAAGDVVACVRRRAEPPLPGNSAAFGALMVIWEHVPRLEAALRLAVTGHPGQRRGGSAGNLLAALHAIPGLAAGLDEDAEGAVARILEWLCNLARIIPDIDEAQQWRRIRNHPCRYCGCYYLEVLLSGGQATTHIECHAAALPGRGGSALRGDRPGDAPGVDCSAMISSRTDR